MHKHVLSAVALAATTAGLVAPAAPALAAPLPAHAAIAAHAHVPGTLHWHDHGPAVARAQRLLGLKPTGTFDLHMLRAVQRFQRAHHIRATGNVGPVTWAALLRGESGQTANQALAAAKTRAGASLADLADAIDFTREGVKIDSTSIGLLTKADVAVLNGRLDRVDAHGQALSDALDKARAIGWVNEINARAGHYVVVTEAIGSQAGVATSLHPDLVVALFTKVFDQVVQAAADAGQPVDPAKESAARAAVFSAMRDYLTAAAPYARKAWAIDPLSAGAPARIAALQHQADNLPQGKPLEAALKSYGKVIGASFDATMPSLRAGSRPTRSHVAAELPKLPWLP